MVQFRLELVTTPATIKKRIVKSIKDTLNLRLSRIGATLTRPVAKLIIDAIRNSPEVQSILGVGERESLHTQLGIVNPEKVIEQLLGIWEKGIHVTNKPLRQVGNELKGGYKIMAIMSSYEDVLNSGVGEFTSENGFPVPWLQWLLIEGSGTIIKDYEIVFNRPLRSRTNNAIMEKGRGWRVPPQFAGTPRNNFVTRSIDSVSNEIEKLIIDTTTKRLLIM